MFDLDVGKILVVGTIALIVVGPKDLPRVLRIVGQVVGKMRRMANDVQNQVMEAVKEADLEGVKKELGALNDSANFKVSVDPASAMRGHSTQTPQIANESAKATPNSQISAAPTYASAEMKEYLAVLPGSDAEKSEIANENIKPELANEAMRDEAHRKALGSAS